MLSKESALSDLDCVDKLLGMIAPILKDPPNEDGGDGDAAMQVRRAVGGRGHRGVCGVWCLLRRACTSSVIFVGRVLCLIGDSGGGGGSGDLFLSLVAGRSGRLQGRTRL